MSDICTLFCAAVERIIAVMIRDDQIARLMGGGALALLLGAIGFQYVAHLAQCEMCHWQRWPYIAAAIAGLAIVSFWKSRTLAIFTIVMIALSGLIGAYQTGMQMGIL